MYVSVAYKTFLDAFFKEMHRMDFSFFASFSYSDLEICRMKCFVRRSWQIFLTCPIFRRIASVDISEFSRLLTSGDSPISSVTNTIQSFGPWLVRPCTTLAWLSTTLVNSPLMQSHGTHGSHIPEPASQKSTSARVASASTFLLRRTANMIVHVPIT